jgi:hypothetical protein
MAQNIIPPMFLYLVRWYKGDVLTVAIVWKNSGISPEKCV